MVRVNRNGTQSGAGNGSGRLEGLDSPPSGMGGGNVIYRQLLGCFVSQDDLSVAIVGARTASTYGRKMACELAHELAGCGVCVVSGLACGIDSEAHRYALEAGGRTIAVLGSGLDVMYPREHIALAE